MPGRSSGCSRELELLEEAFRDKGREFTGILKVGRTQLQDAVPMTLEQEFEGFAVTLADDQRELRGRRRSALGDQPRGARRSAPGSPRIRATRTPCAGISPRSRATDIVTAPNLVEATTDVGVFMELSGALKRSAMKLSKICNDLRLLSSGPQAGLGEINLPPRQAGSSIMPGKVNPVIPEVVNQVAFAVAGRDVTVTMAAEAGQLQLNAFEPVMAHVLFESLQWMTAAMTTLRVNCVTASPSTRIASPSRSARSSA